MPEKSSAINQQSLDGSKSGRSIASVCCTSTHSGFRLLGAPSLLRDVRQFRAGRAFTLGAAFDPVG